MSGRVREFLQVVDELTGRQRTPEEAATVVDVGRAEVVFLEILRDAGFAPHSLQVRQLRGNYMDQDGTNTGETYPVNSFCPFVVMREENEFWANEAKLVPDYRTTVWLEQVVQETRELLKDPPSAESKLREHVERARPLEPIVLSEFGDTLVEVLGDLAEHARDGDLIWRRAVMHRSCHGTFEVVGCSDSYRVLVCKKCHFRTYLPVAVRTFGQLRLHAHQQVALKNVPVFSLVGEVRVCDSLCPACGLKQYESSSGVTCSNGHGSVHEQRTGRGT